VIFVTVGSQMPFDRLIRAVDEWAGLRGRSDVFAQIGPSEYRAKHIEVTQFLNQSEFRDRVHSARVVVAHAGIGSIITALEIGKPIVIMPRRAHLREATSDHQVATAKQFAHLQSIIVAIDEQELFSKLYQAETLSVTNQIRAEASSSLISTVRAFIEVAETTRRRR
jgi:UDP-N-acetylglucosamine transferase subunit ALG13